MHNAQSGRLHTLLDRTTFDCGAFSYRSHLLSIPAPLSGPRRSLNLRRTRCHRIAQHERRMRSAIHHKHCNHCQSSTSRLDRTPCALGASNGDDCRHEALPRLQKFTRFQLDKSCSSLHRCRGVADKNFLSFLVQQTPKFVQPI